MPVSGTRISASSPAYTRAVSAVGCGGALLSASEACTATRTVADVLFSMGSETVKVTVTSVGVSGAWYRSTSPETNMRPWPAVGAPPSSRSSVSGSPSGS